MGWAWASAVLEEGAALVASGPGRPGVTGPLEDALQPSMSQLKRWCFTSMSWTPSFRGFFSSCTQTAPHCHGMHSWGTQQGSPRWSLPVTPAPRVPPGPCLSLPQVCELTRLHTPGLPRPSEDQARPPTSLFTGSSQSWERLKAKQQRTLAGRRGGCQSPSGWLCPPLP